MQEPKLYDRFDRQSAIAATGATPEARSFCDGQWVIWDNAAICFADLGEPHYKSYFESGGTFAWVAERPYAVSNEAYMTFVPQEVVGPENASRTIWLFVRSGPTGVYRLIGRLYSCHRAQNSAQFNHGEAYFALTPAIPSEVWQQLGGFDPGDQVYATVDSALESLQGETNTAERLEILKTLVRFWHGEISPNDGMSEAELAGIDMPSVLRWWYRYAGHRGNILTGQNKLMPPARLSLNSDGKLVFYGENQWCYQWATLTDEDDPLVFGREDDSQPWSSEGITLSEHLILACLFEGIMCHSCYGASAAWLNEDIVAQIIDRIPSVAISGWNWCDKTRFFAKNGAFMFVSGNGDFYGAKGYSVWIGSKTEKPVAFLKPMLNDSWDYISV